MGAMCKCVEGSDGVAQRGVWFYYKTAHPTLLPAVYWTPGATGHPSLNQLYAPSTFGLKFPLTSVRRRLAQSEGHPTTEQHSQACTHHTTLIRLSAT